MYINVITPKKETKSQIRCQSLLKLRNSNDHVVMHFVSNFRVYSYRVDTVNWLNRLAESRGLSIKVYLNEVYVGMFHGAESCTMEIFCTTILILSVFAVISKQIEEYIYDVNECQTHIHDAHIHLHIQPVHSWLSTDTRNNNELADNENKLYYMHFYLNVNDSHIHGMFIQTRFNKNKSHICIMFQRYIYNYVHFRLRCLDSVFHNE